MLQKDFDEIMNHQIDRCKSILNQKAKEYATHDRLHNFKLAAELQECSTKRALSGMLSKHTISLYDMCGGTEEYPMSMWEEKITDHINYLLLLKAVIFEEKEKTR